MIRATIPKKFTMAYRPDLPPEASKQTAASVLIAPAGKKAADAPGSALPANKTTRSDSAIPSAHPPTVNEAPASPPFLGNREIEQVGGPVSAAWREGTLTAQQVFTRLADQQGQNVLNSVRGANRPQTNTTPP
jgi:hypothetical protein